MIDRQIRSLITSIHASTREATGEVVETPYPDITSIHASTREATKHKIIYQLF